jgi:outer membrane receptor protein involved in Fe transport
MGYEDAKKDTGLPVQQVPDWTGNAWGTYSHPLGDTGWSTLTGVDWSYIGRTFSANNDPLNPRERPAYRLLDARFALQHDTFEVAVVAKNITNEYAVLGDSRSLAAEVPGRPRLVTNQPFTMGLELRQRF